MPNLIGSLKSKPLFSRVLLSLFLSGIGTSFTSVAVYEKLAQQKWGALAFSLAFCAGLLPGFITSIIAGKYARQWPMGTVLAKSQLVGLFALIFPLIGTITNQIEFLITAEVTTSAISGLLIPLYKTIERQSFEDHELISLSALDTFLLTANFIFGQGLGALLVSHVSFTYFLSFTALLYGISFITLHPLQQAYRPLDETDRPQKPLFNSERKKVLWVLPWLAIVCAPLMILLPARGVDFQPLLGIKPALFLLCSRSLGQLIGPWLALLFDLKSFSQSPKALALGLGFYLIFYAGAFHTSSLIFAGILCVLAHISSNLVYAAGNFLLLKYFDGDSIGWAAGFIHRTMTLVTSIAGIIGGFIATSVNWDAILFISLLNCIVGYYFLRPQKIKTGMEYA